jgi:hypothetical protein
MVYGNFIKWALRFTAMVLAVACLDPLSAFAQTFGAGTFEGIIQSGSNNDEGFGFVILTLARTGAFTMRFNVGINYVGRHSYVKTGKFDSSGHWHIEGPAPADTRYEIPVNMDLQLDSIDNPTRISGNLNDYTHSSNISMERIFVATRGNPAQQAGVYTFLFSATRQPDPNGTGWGRVIVTSTGVISCAGRTPDGRAFSQRAWVTVFNHWPVFTKMAGITNGIFSGWLNFSSTSSSDFNGQLTWIGPEVPGPNHAFVPEFVTSINVVGSRYTVPFRTTILGLRSNTNNVHLTFTDGGIEGEIDKDVTMLSNDRILFNPVQRGQTLTFSPATGLFVGAFQHSDGRFYIYRGAVLQKQNYAAGQFVTIDHDSGSILIRPN